MNGCNLIVHVVSEDLKDFANHVRTIDGSSWGGDVAEPVGMGLILVLLRGNSPTFIGV